MRIFYEMANTLSIYVLVIASICHHSSSEKTTLSKIGLIPWNTITESVVMDMLHGLDPLTVVTVPMDTAKSPYAHIVNTYSLLESLELLALIGPYTRTVALATEALHIPYLSVTEVTSESRNYTLELSPGMGDIGLAAYDMANNFQWSKISVFYDDDRGVRLLEKLMTNHTMTVRGWRLSHDASNADIKKCLVEMRKVLVEQTVVFCSRNNTRGILDQARGLAMLSTPPYQWLFYDPGHELQDILLLHDDIALNFSVLSVLPFDVTSPRAGVGHLDYAYLTEALSLVTTAYFSITKNDVIDIVQDFREEVNGLVRQVSVNGTGHTEFNSEGKRDNLTLYVTALTGDRILTYGRWCSDVPMYGRRLQLNGSPSYGNKSRPFPLKGRTAKVVMIEERPFTMLKRDYIMRKGNDRFKGFAIDLIREVAGMLKFDYEIYLVPDGKFGSKLDSGEWNGMIGELLAGNATMSVASLSINSDREEAVDFTKPFMTRYINVLMRMPTRETSYFEFLNPLSPVVWICTLCAFVIVSIVLYSLERIGSSCRSSPANTTAAERVPPRITMREAFWFIFGSLLQGNTDSSPMTIPGRILTSAWWFFALILISSYTANLAAFLTVKKINTPIKSVTDLAQQTKIKYGTVKSSGVMGFFKNTNIEHFAKMWAQMSEIEPDSMVDNTTQGFQKVKDEDYAFFWDTTVNKYKTIIDCDLMEIGPSFDPKGFGIGVPPGATYRDELSMAILKLSDTGKLHELETKYWGERFCPDLSKSSSEETSELQIDNVAGVFFILVGGIVIAAVVCLGEYVGHALLRASKQQQGSAPEKAPRSEVFL
ncbi:glutamate receptor ionotropic, kainate 3-like isoform X2 [Littorina saxatilis]|uniref:glutamate receptor ionotropic, kainate 3-like isoform X2 n=1 Tax=Littorina saxatilis TaxID=31220 RepID=UPI0038B43A56